MAWILLGSQDPIGAHCGRNIRSSAAKEYHSLHHWNRLLVTMVVGWASVLSCKYLGCNAPLFSFFGGSWSPALTILSYCGQSSVVTYLVYAVGYVCCICPCASESVRKAVTDRETTLKSRPYCRLLNNRFQKSRPMDLIEYVDDKAARRAIKYMQSGKAYLYAPLSALSVGLLWLIFDFKTICKAWTGSYTNALGVKGDEWFPGDPWVVACFMAMVYLIIAPAFYYAAHFILTVLFKYRIALYSVEALATLPAFVWENTVVGLALFHFVRKFYLQYKIPVLYHTAETGFMVVVTWCVLFTALMVTQVFLRGSAAFVLFSTQLFALLALFFVYPTLLIMSTAVEVWEAQQRHGKMLQELKLTISIRKIRGIDDTDYMNGLEQIIDLLVARVIERDEPPRIFGMAIKPTLYQVLQGYLVSAIAVIAGKFLSMS